MKQRPYKIERRADGIFFVCIKCDHAVKVERESVGAGSSRTAAATAIMEHVRSHGNKREQIAEPVATGGPRLGW